ncbi:head GIN domain-containing protein [Negadavirga shengliensis]|uniref:Head GIN domain-containing protein n=1 Tax=Negadavirga shengliensis TaxID=1389218 RepID=A0ABV9T818_9BACT
MKLSITAILICLVSVCMAQTSQESRTLKAFDKIKVSNAIEAELIKGNTHEIEITASGIALDKVETEVKNRTLDLKISGSSPRSSTVKVKIIYAKLEDVSVSTSAKVFVRDTLESQTVKLNTATNGYLEAAVKARSLSLDAQTNSQMSLRGTADQLYFNAFTNAQIDGDGLEANNAEVRVNTNASGTFKVLESIKGTAATRGRVKYTGNPNLVDVKVNTGGAIDGP